MNIFIQKKQESLEGSLDHYRKELSTLRTGRANPSMLDSIFVDAYGAKTQLSGVGSITVPDAKCIVVAPWDKNLAKNIEKALVEANLGVGVVNEGDKIRLTLPAMTEENRRDLVKSLNERTEKAKVSFRQIRDDIKNEIEDAAKNKEFGEDDKFRFIKELDELIAKKNEEIKEIRDKKEKEIMTI